MKQEKERKLLMLVFEMSIQCPLMMKGFAAVDARELYGSAGFLIEKKIQFRISQMENLNTTEK